VLLFILKLLPRDINFTRDLTYLRRLTEAELSLILDSPNHKQLVSCIISFIRVHGIPVVEEVSYVELATRD
jgi:hypothetical protein